ncbi:hypothetical protein CFP56_010477 [Quercus suber]|uniref:Uncharacterized protein n=1 Tax=Quercus suber TaxID=58331 RepID=A0AAW0M5F6_QUESU|nr:hypothetical protein CFP56_06803 [Quercus suber]
MAFTISKVQAEKITINHSEEKDSEILSPISSQLYLKSSTQAPSKTLDKEAVLRRIRLHKNLNKIRGALQALVAGSSEQTNIASMLEQKWQDPEDAFSAP